VQRQYRHVPLGIRPRLYFHIVSAHTSLSKLSEPLGLVAESPRQVVASGVTAFTLLQFARFNRAHRKTAHGIAILHPREEIGGRGLLDTHTLNFLLIQTRGWAMKELLEMIAKALVNHPEEVEVRSVEGEQVIMLELCVHREDVGEVIGRQGRIAEAIRTIFGAVWHEAA
jgi:uncharacterized protein